MRCSERRVQDYETLKKDLIRDLQDNNGLKDLSLKFSREKKEIDMIIYRLSKDCEKLYEALREIQDEKKMVQNRLVSR